MKLNLTLKMLPTIIIIIIIIIINIININYIYAG